MYRLIIILFLTPLSSFSQWAPYQFNLYSGTSEGYYFLCPNRQNGPGSSFKNQMILDATGDVVFYRPVPGNTPDFKLQPNGMISYFRSNKYYLMDSTFTIVDSVSVAGGYETDSHEMLILPNGHYLLLGAHTLIMDLSSYPMFYHNGTNGSSTATVKYNIIQELDANKNVVFEWHAKDYFQFDDVDENWLFNAFNVDWTHCNALEVDTDGNILMSSRHFNEITKVNRSDSSIIWRFGGKRNDFTFLNDTIPFLGQHDIRRLDNGDVSLYDNGYHSTSAPWHPARALEYTLDEVGMTAFLSFAYIHDSAMYSRATGNFQHMPNGNALINYGQVAFGNVCFVVIDSAGSKVCELIFPDTLSSYRSFNFQDLPWSFHRPVINCIDSAGTWYLDAGAGHASYQWSDGSTTQFVPAIATDTFTVFVPYGQGGFISSEKFMVDSVNNPCGLFTSLALPSVTAEEIQISPNPASEKVFVSRFPIASSDKYDVEKTVIEIYDLPGKKVLNSSLLLTHQRAEIDISNLRSGIYIVNVITKAKSYRTKLIID